MPDLGTETPTTTEPQIGAPSSFTDLSRSIMSAEEQWRGATEKQAKTMEESAGRIKPVLAEARESIGTAEKTRKDALTKLESAQPNFPAPPSRQLHEFLAPVEGESPTASVMKLIQAVGLFATGIGGMARGDARSGLAALTGALKGWQEGDAERADRHFSDWKEKTGAALKAWDVEQQTYQRIMEDANLSIEQKIKMAELAAIENKNENALAAFRSGAAKDALDFLTTQQTHADAVGLKLATLAQSKAERDRQMTETERHNREVEEQRVREAQQRAEDAAARLDEKIREFNAKGEASKDNAIPEVTLDYVADQVLMGKPMSDFPLGMGKASTEARLKILDKVRERATRAGMTPEDAAVKTMAYRATQAELSRLQSQRGLVTAFARKFESDAALALKYSDAEDRSGVPAWNRYARAGKKNIQGDADVAVLDAAVQTLASEYSKVSSGSTQGSDSARHEALSMINGAMTKEQFRRVVNDVLLKDVANREKGYEEQIKRAQESLKSLTTPMPAPPPLDKPKEQPKSGTMRIRKKGTKQVYEGPAGTKIPDDWEEVLQ